MVFEERLQEIPVLLPYLQRLGYNGEARYLALWWRPVFDAPQWVDGQGNWEIARPSSSLWRENILPVLHDERANCGTRDSFGQHVIVWNRVNQRAWIAPRQVGLAFVAMTT